MIEVVPMKVAGQRGAAAGERFARFAQPRLSGLDAGLEAFAALVDPVAELDDLVADTNTGAG